MACSRPRRGSRRAVSTSPLQVRITLRLFSDLQFATRNDNSDLKLLFSRAALAGCVVPGIWTVSSLWRCPAQPTASVFQYVAASYTATSFTGEIILCALCSRSFDQSQAALRLQTVQPDTPCSRFQLAPSGEIQSTFATQFHLRFAEIRGPVPLRLTHSFAFRHAESSTRRARTCAWAIGKSFRLSSSMAISVRCASTRACSPQ